MATTGQDQLPNPLVNQQQSLALTLLTYKNPWEQVDRIRTIPSLLSFDSGIFQNET